MVWVNLLPWRQVQHQKGWRVWRLAGAVLVVALLMLMLEGYGQHRLHQQKNLTQDLLNAALKDAQALRGRIQALQQQLSALQHQQERFERSQQQLSEWHDFARSLGARVPAESWLTTLHKTRKGLMLSGVASGIKELHQLRDSLREVALFSQVSLGPVQRIRAGEVTFDMQATPVWSAGATK